MKKISLIQPRHTYAPEGGDGHIYLPTSLLTAGARILQAGGVVHNLQDLNFRPLSNTAEVIGVNLLGAPYIPEVHRQIQATTKNGIRLIVGGQVVNGLVQKDESGKTVSRYQLDALFGKESVNGNDDGELAAALGIDSRDLPAPSQTSLIPSYEMISDKDMYQYLSKEISFYLSQGCNKACTFCAAVRSMRDPITGKMKKVIEEYRSPGILEKDFKYLVERAKKLGISKLAIYLSNLDLFQTPGKLLEFAHIIQSIQKESCDFQIQMRGLSTVSSFLYTHQRFPGAIKCIVDAGLTHVGFGIDGATPEIWKSIHKSHNTEEKCYDAIRISREVYGITPEALMVFGHSNETEISLKAAVEFTGAMGEKYGAIPRPHVAKDIVPANEDWPKLEHQGRVRILIENPQYFQALDFTALPSGISHPNKELRLMVAKYYREITSIHGNTTQLVYPISPEVNDETLEEYRRLNIGKFDR